MTTLIPSIPKPSKYRDLYPPIQPYDTFMFKVSDIHTLYVEQSGNKNGKPVIVLHGGFVIINAINHDITHTVV